MHDYKDTPHTNPIAELFAETRTIIAELAALLREADAPLFQQRGTAGLRDRIHTALRWVDR